MSLTDQEIDRIIEMAWEDRTLLRLFIFSLIFRTGSYRSNEEGIEGKKLEKMA